MYIIYMYIIYMYIIYMYIIYLTIGNDFTHKVLQTTFSAHFGNWKPL